MRSWTIRVVQEFVVFSDSAEDVLATMERLERRTVEGLALMNHTAMAAPSLKPEPEEAPT